MLETDCKIPSEPIRIEQLPYKLYGTAAAIKGMLDAGHHPAYIRKTLCISKEEYRDEIYEIRKAGCSMKRTAKSGKLAGKYAEIYEAWKNGQTVTALAEQYDVSLPSISYIIKKMKQKEENTVQVNQEIENTDEPVTETKEHTAAIPAIVLRSTAKMIAQLNAEIAAAEHQLDTLRHDREELTAWLKEVGADDGDPAD